METTIETPEPRIATVVSYNSEEDVTTTYTLTIDTTSHVQESSTDVIVPQPTTEAVPEEITPEYVPPASVTTLSHSVSIVYTPEDTPAVSTFEGSGVINTPAFAAVFGLVLYLF